MNIAKITFNNMTDELPEGEWKELEDSAAQSVVFNEESPEIIPKLLSHFK